jgi:hypothetical protein
VNTEEQRKTYDQALVGGSYVPVIRFRRDYARRVKVTESLQPVLHDNNTSNGPCVIAKIRDRGQEQSEKKAA